MPRCWRAGLRSLCSADGRGSTSRWSARRSTSTCAGRSRCCQAGATRSPAPTWRRGVPSGPADRVHQQMALAALDQLAAIKAALEPTPLDRLDGLAVEDCDGWLRIATSSPTNIRSQVVVQLLPGAIIAQATEVGPGSAPGDEVTRDHPPLSATPG